MQSQKYRRKNLDAKALIATTIRSRNIFATTVIATLSPQLIRQNFCLAEVATKYWRRHFKSVVAK